MLPHAPRLPCRTLRTVCPRLATVLTLVLAGCATYHPRPLGEGRGAASVAQLAAPAKNFAGIPRNHRFDPSDGLDVTEVATLAVANSPALKVQRDALGIARAQAFAAGLLPDPQLSLGQDFPSPSGPGLTSAFTLGLSADLTALLTRSSRVAAARGQARQVNLDLLWAEWQTVAQARLLFDQVATLRAQSTRLNAELAALTPVATHIRTALDQGNLTYDAASAGLNAQADVRKRLADTEVALHQADADLHRLLGLAPDAPLTLVGPAYTTAPTAAQVQRALAELPRRRPDLLALQAGYASQEASLRAAVLAQFPALNIGFNRARDTGGIYTKGYSLGISLPLFDRNRGNIAIARATRQQLRDDYAARVLATRTDIERLRSDLITLDRQRTSLAAHTRRLERASLAAQHAWQARELDWPTYLAIRNNTLTAEMDLLAVKQQQATQAIALEALLGNTDLVTPPPVSAKASTP